jgi:hypothetical protein
LALELEELYIGFKPNKEQGIIDIRLSEINPFLGLTFFAYNLRAT